MATKKDSDEKRVDEISGKFQEITLINIGGGKIGDVVFDKGIVRNDLDIFIKALHAISERHSEKRPRLIQFLYEVFNRREIEKISSILELKDLIQILTRKDFYQTTGREKQEKYIGIMLNYLERELPEDYGFLLSHFLLVDVPVENRHQIDVVTRLIVQRLAGDITTDAPPPDVKKKKPMDPITLATAATSLLAPFIQKAGAAALDKIAEQLPDTLGKVWNVISNKSSNIMEAASDLAKNPDDADNEAFFKKQLQKALEKDQDFASQLTDLLEKAKGDSSINIGGIGVVADNNSTAVGNISIGGSVSEDITIGHNRPPGDPTTDAPPPSAKK